MTDSNMSAQTLLANQFFQVADGTYMLSQFNLSMIHHGDSGRIVSTILQLL